MAGVAVQSPALSTIQKGTQRVAAWSALCLGWCVINIWQPGMGQDGRNPLVSVVEEIKIPFFSIEPLKHRHGLL